MALMDFFKPAAQAQQQTQPQAQPNPGQQPTGQQSTNTPPSGITSGVVDPANANSGNNNQAENPLDAFKGMFDNTANNTEKAPSFSLPLDKLQEIASKQNFTANVDPELMKKALSGDAESLLAIINSSAQNAYARSLEHTSSLSDSYVNSRFEYEGKSFGNKVKEQLTTSELGNTPGFDHPIVKAQLTSTAKDLAKMYPDASPQEIAKKARDYVTSLAQAINPQSKTEAESNSAKETDWDKYFG